MDPDSLNSLDLLGPLGLGTPVVPWDHETLFDPWDLGSPLVPWAPGNLLGL
ncbi:hypothetical protein LBYZC6_25280 [Lacrimispora brassicae]